MVRKIDGWEKRLEYTIAHYIKTPFNWGDADCVCFVSDVMSAVCGYDPIAPYRGQWKNEKTAKAALLKYAKGGFDEIFYGLTIVPHYKMASRGDVGIMMHEGKEYCGAVGLNGRSFLVRRNNGLEAFHIADNLRLWRAN